LGWLVFHRSSYSFKADQLWKDFKINLSFGKWTLASSLLWGLGMTIYPWLLAYFHGISATGIWAACWGIIAIANPLLLGIQNFLGPKIVQSYTQGGAMALRGFVLRISAIYFLIIALPALILFIFGGKLVVLFYGNQYAGNGHIIAILAVNLLVMASSFTLSRALLAMEQARVYFMANIVPLIIMFTIGIMLVKKLGPAGVAWGFLLGTGTTAITMLWLFVVLIKKDIIREEGYE
jgi:O-antigen/teichoic acid export membrane protein